VCNPCRFCCVMQTSHDHCCKLAGHDYGKGFTATCLRCGWRDPDHIVIATIDGGRELVVRTADYARLHSLADHASIHSLRGPLRTETRH
jgi:anaerobic ribonucleoside-triphosphate reductase